MSVTRHIAWTFGARFGGQAVQIAFGVVLARLLTPADFGLMGMIAVVTGFAILMGEAGLSSALIYLDEASDEAFSTAFWLQLAIGLCLACGLLLASSGIARFYGHDLLAPIARLVSVTFLLQALVQVQGARLARQARFRAIAIVNLAAAMAGSGCALLLALLGYGPWALAWSAVASSAMLAAGSTVAARWLPSITVSAAAARRMVGYGAPLLLHNGLNYWMRNGDNLLIGRVLGSAPLGIYNRAYMLMLLPLQNIGAIVGQVMFPTLSRMRDDPVGFRALYLASIRNIALVAFPLMVGMCVLAEPILDVLYGRQWTAAASVLRILSLVGALQCVIFPVGWIYTALGLTRTQLRVSLALAPPFVLMILAGLPFGLVGIAWGYAAWALLSAALNVHVAGRLIDVGLPLYARQLVLKAAAAAAMAGVVWAIDRLGMPGAAVPMRLAYAVPAGAIVYATGLLLLRDPELMAVLARAGARRPVFRRRADAA